MSRFKIELATEADDRPLCELLAATPMQGDVSVTFARQPSYFAATAVDGSSVQVCVARDREGLVRVGAELGLRGG